MCRQTYLRFHKCPCELKYKLEECPFGISDPRCHEVKVSLNDEDRGRNQYGRNRLQQRRGYISPYHESPVDLDKYDAEMRAASEKAKAQNTCCVEGNERAEGGKSKKRKTGKLSTRPLATGCAANFKTFGGNGAVTNALFDD
ncbi:hypothetical protein GGR51DRAFT_558557 [Nemania sp. FL0031]|nr:hypothetical protein GGR51DRAFT_558557 [Nemania sp. FL0031]